MHMPLFDFKCVECQHIMTDVVCPSDHRPPCSKCTAPTEKYFCRGAPVHIFKEGMYEHVAETPQYFSSKRKLKHFCKEQGVTMDYCE